MAKYNTAKYVYWQVLVLVFLWFAVPILSAQDSLKEASAPTASLWGYPVNARLSKVAAVGSADTSSFNRGLMAAPAELLQGHIAGVQVYNRGGNPNTPALFRVRGLSSYSQRQPLLVVDGIAGASWYSLDPEDIASVTVLKDGASQAMYGMRASNGVVLVRTKTGCFQQDTLAVSYHGQLAASTPYSGFPIMDAATFREAGHWDFGGATDWPEQVQRNAWSQAHNLAVSGRKAETNFRIAGHFRDVEGVLQQSGFAQTNIRAFLNRSFFRNALDIKIHAAYTNRNNQLGFPQAFRYAVGFNPTIPLQLEGLPFSYNESFTGGFYETINLFDSFNPAAIVALNSNEGRTELVQTSALATYQISQRFSIQARYALQNQFDNQRAFYSPDSYFRGNAYSYFEEQRGRADLSDQSADRSLYEAFLHYSKRSGKVNLQATAGTSYTNTSRTSEQLSLFGFDDAALLSNKRISDYDAWAADVYRADTSSSAWSERVSALFGQMQISINERFHAFASLRYETASKLGKNNNRALFPAVAAGYELIRPKATSAIEQLLLRASYGTTGALPDEAGLSRRRLRTIRFPNGFVDTTVIHNANPDLGPEKKTEFNLGLSLRSGRLRAEVDWYTRTVSDWIVRSFMSGPVYTNQNAFRTSGLDLSLQLALVERPGFRYTTGLQGTAYRSVYQETGRDNPALLLNPGNIFGTPTVIMQQSGRVGELAGPQFTGQVEEGAPVFEDQNGDGVINLQPELYGQPESDLVALGNGLPSFDWGWMHRLQWSSWEVRIMLRGAFGHSMANMHRLRYEPRPRRLSKSYYNLFAGESALEELKIRQFSSYYTERADFVKLDHLQVAKTFTFQQAGRPYQLQLSLTARSILLASRYSGIDPEPVLEDAGTTTNGGYLSADQRNPLVAGVDRLDFYLPARQFVFGMSLSL